MPAVIDAGPLVAVLDTGDREHASCVEALRHLSGSLFTTWVAFAEAMYLLRRAGWSGQEHLWKLQQSGTLVIADLDSDAQERAAILMEKYQNVPMSLGDATIVAVSESLEIRQVFTLDRDFEVYRYKDRQKFDLVPRR